MKTYEVKKNIATFGVGMVLELTEEQAEIRSDSVSKRGKYYVVNSPITFKCGEKVNVVSGEVSKALVDNLMEAKEQNVNTENSDSDKSGGNSGNDEDGENGNDDIEFPAMQHLGFGKYDVFDANGEKANEEPIKKAEAEKLLGELKAKNGV